MRATSLLVLALVAGLAHAAPAPFAKPERSEQAPVFLTALLPEARLTGHPPVIACLPG